MPGLVRKLLIFAAVDGLILQPTSARNHPVSTQQAIKIDYKGNVSPSLKDIRDESDESSSLEVYGIVGLFKVATSSFLILICDREQVAHIRNKPIFKITDVTLIPLSSEAEAHRAIISAREHVQRHQRTQALGEEDYDSEIEDNAPSVTDSLIESVTTRPVEVTDPLTNQHKPLENKTSVAEDVMQHKGLYGRFAGKWFSQGVWKSDRSRSQGLTSGGGVASSEPENDGSNTLDGEEVVKAPSKPQDVPSKDETVSAAVSPTDIPRALDNSTDNGTYTLIPKILRTTKLYFSSGNFFFSYDYDLSRSVSEQKPTSSVPLAKQYDNLFYWNQHIMSAFSDAGQYAFVLPIIQGFVGQRSFSIKTANNRSNSVVIDSFSNPNDIQLMSFDSINATEAELESQHQSMTGKDFLLTLISRRSTRRAGLRYLRRGVDDEGSAANSVETEQILSLSTWSTLQDKIFSFTQLRGSIPLFFSQSPYSLKPQVDTWGSKDTNLKAFSRHFQGLWSRYGLVYAVSLVDKHGTEAKIGQLYEQHAKALIEFEGTDGKETQLGFHWFDFHNICRGMRFENVSQLMTTLAPFFKTSHWSEISQEELVRKQSGVLRTNCMDCLDRTNVVQSACARIALEEQLSDGGFDIDLQNDPSTSWFNTLWADNGDAISRQYAGTAALKGDFTRTRKRQITGALTDFGLTLTRYYNNIVNDYFAQALIDYLLGRATDSIFAEFEADMKSTDYFIDLRKVRQAAIERCAEIVIEDKDEDFIHGWTLSVPTQSNSLKTATFEEAVLLLTEKALYFCRLDWGTEKVREFEHIWLEDITGIFRGVYITSTLAQRHMDEKQNVGFVVQYRTKSTGALVRRNTRSLASRPESAPLDEKRPTELAQNTTPFLAFKALSPRSSIAVSGMSEKLENEVELVKNICDEIMRITNTQKKKEAVVTHEEGEIETQITVYEKDVISLEDARKSTGYLEQLGYSLKKLVWS